MYINKGKTQNLKGFALFELLLAFSVLTFCLVFCLQLFSFNFTSVTSTTLRDGWLTLGVSYMKDLVTKDFDTITSTTTNDAVNKVLSTIAILYPNPYSKEVTLALSSIEKYARIQPVILKRTFFDFERRGEMNTCVDHFSGDWDHPAVLSSISLTGSSTASSLVVQRGIAYLGVNSATKSDKDLYIFDISNPQHITTLSSIDTGPGVMDIALSWPYLYLANTSINGQLQVVDVTNASNPILKLTYKLPGGFKDIGYVGNRVVVYKHVLAFGTRKSDGPEFHLIDITNPLAPVELSSYEFNTSINDLFFVTKEKILAATPLDEELTILDVSNTAFIKRLGGFNAIGLSGSGNSLYVLGDTVYMGRTVGQQELQILDTTDSTQPVLKGSGILKTSIEGMFVRDGLAFVSTIDALKQFQVVDVHTDSPFSKSSLSLSGRGVAIDCDKEVLFIATTGVPAFYSIGRT